MKQMMIAMVMLAGCTVHQHHIFQRSMASVVTVGFACDAGQTITAIRRDPDQTEANPIVRMIGGARPRWELTATTATIGAAIGWSIAAFRHDDGIEWNWLQSMAITGWTMIEAGAVISNARNIDRAERCGL